MPTLEELAQPIPTGNVEEVHPFKDASTDEVMFNNQVKSMESDHGSTPQATKDAGDTDSKDIGYGHKLTDKEQNSGEIFGVSFNKPGGLTQGEKSHVLLQDMNIKQSRARRKSWDSKLADLGTTWEQLDKGYRNVLTSLAYNMGANAASKYSKVLSAAHNRDTVWFAEEIRRKADGKHTAGMDNRALKELYAAGLIRGRSAVATALPLSNARQAGVPD